MKLQCHARELLFAATDSFGSFIATFAIVSIGVCLFSFVFLYEDEQKKLQSVLEDSWIWISDASRAAISFHIRFMHEVARLEISFLDYLFGERLVSFRAVAVSMGLSLAVPIYMEVTDLLEAYPSAFSKLGNFLESWAAIVATTIVYLLTALVIRYPRLSPWVIGFYCVGLFLDNCIAFIAHDVHNRLRLNFTDIIYDAALESRIHVIVLACAVLCDFLFVLITRQMTKRISQSDNLSGILKPLFWKFVAALEFVLVPAIIAEQLLSNYPGVPPLSPISYLIDFFALLSLLNITVFVPAALFLVFMLLMLIHRSFWPIPDRVAYLIQASGIPRRRKILAGLGLLLIAVAMPGTKSFLVSLMKLI